MNVKRKIEVFTAGCPCCDEAVKLVQSLGCPNCEVAVLDMKSDRQAQEKAKEYGVKRVPAVVVDDRLADCCTGGMEAAALRRLGVGVAA